MENGITNGVTEMGDISLGLKTLIGGYMDYATEVVLDRAIPAIDGFKPSQRRILYTMYRNKNTSLAKSANVVGEVMKLHPHGDMPIYQTLVRMTDVSLYQSVPFISGKGHFGKVYFTEGAAASRYTECKLSQYSNLLFGEMAGVDYTPSYDNRLQEPVTLSPAFPNILVNASQGIAVGMASNIPSFNMVEVNNAVIDLIEKGDINYVLAPDFPTGGEYIRNDASLRSIMETGKGRLKFRGKWVVEGNSIVITELPFYTNIDRVQNMIKDCPGVKDVRDESDFNGFRLVIDCNRSRVQDVLTVLLKDTDLQMSMSANISVIIDGKPKFLGIKELLREWIKFRKGVLKKKFELDLSAIQSDIKRYEFLVSLLDNKDNLDLYIDELKKSEQSGIAVLRSIDNTVSDSIIDWIMGLSLKSISNIGKKKRHLEDLYDSERDIKQKLSNLEGVICEQLRYINSTYGVSRKTVITDVDYEFSKVVEEVEVKTVPVYVTISDKFIKKIPYYVDNPSEYIYCESNEDILCIDTWGRVLRLHLDDIPDTKNGSTGTYIPVYLNIPDDFDIVSYDVEHDEDVKYLYADGYASTFNFGAWSGNKRKLRVIQNGASPLSGKIVGCVSSYPYMAFYTKNGRFGFAPTDFNQKSPTARTKLITLDKDDELQCWVGCTYEDMLRMCMNYGVYLGACKRVQSKAPVDFGVFQELLNRGE